MKAKFKKGDKVGKLVVLSDGSMRKSEFTVRNAIMTRYGAWTYQLTAADGSLHEDGKYFATDEIDFV